MKKDQKISDYITDGNFFDVAKQAIQEFDDETNKRNQISDKDKVTTTKLRKLLSMAADLYNEIRLLQKDTLDGQFKGRISYLMVRYLYEAGRGGDSMKKFVEHSQLLEILPTIATREDYLLFYKYMESLIAWHTFRHGNI